MPTDHQLLAAGEYPIGVDARWILTIEETLRTGAQFRLMTIYVAV